MFENFGPPPWDIVAMRKSMEETPGPIPIEEYGLIDRLLVLRDQPISAELLAAVHRNTPVWTHHRNAVDAALDLLVPALQALAKLEQVANHGNNCAFKPDIDKIIGKVPIRGLRARSG